MATAAERVRAYRERQKEKGLPDVTRANRAEHTRRYRQAVGSRCPVRPFVGCDGEGAGVDAQGRQNYMLFRMGSRELFTGERLTTQDILGFICDEPSNSILVGFAFGYDVTMILRDLPEVQQRRLFEPKVWGKGHSPFVWYKEFDIDYLPKNYLRVRRVVVDRTQDGSEIRVPVKGSQRTIYETFGFFQKSFVKVINEFDCGTAAERQSIAESKARRSEFLTIDQTERDYCALECRLLEELMSKLRDYCEEGGIVPRTWSGSGKLAAALHGAHKTPKRVALIGIPEEVDAMANMAYYGGRFEVTRVGSIQQKVYEYDIRSAYPAAMRDLPCLVHGVWEKKDASALRDETGLYVAGVSFRSRDIVGGQMAGLPIRSREGHLYWPLQGRGVYWSPEIRSAQNLGADIKWYDGWGYHSRCDCAPFDWVEALYDYRRSIGSSGPGYPIKLGINSLYGKLAQRKGNGAYCNLIWAGLITAMTRAKINDAIAESVSCYGPGRIVMVATDGLYSLDPLHGLPLGAKLGEWERSDLDGLFIVQPGLYWDPSRRKRKSRGLSGNFFEQGSRTEEFERTWNDYAAACNVDTDTPFPSVSVPVPGFIGLKLALARNRVEKAGTWVDDHRSISFDYRNKRAGHYWVDGHLMTSPKRGGPHTVSLPHRDFLAGGGAEVWENARLMLEEQPDYIDLSAPWKD